jgi:inositol-pentakisphosphate 2-kinase
VDFPALRETFISVVYPLLVHTPVLRTLAKLQRTLDVLDIEGLSKLWALSHLQSPSETHSAGVPPVGSTSLEPSISDWADFVDEYLSTHGALDHTSPKVPDLRYYLLAYLLSGTFKDCSIMLRANPRDDPMPTGSVTVIDLDPKSIARLSRWETLDREIVQSYTDIEGKHCVDGWKDN